MYRNGNSFPSYPLSSVARGHMCSLQREGESALPQQGVGTLQSLFLYPSCQDFGLFKPSGPGFKPRQPCGIQRPVHRAKLWYWTSPFIVSSVSVKNTVGILVYITLNLWIPFDSMNILVILILAHHEHRIFVFLCVFTFVFFQVFAIVLMCLPESENVKMTGRDHLCGGLAVHCSQFSTLLSFWTCVHMCPI